MPTYQYVCTDCGSDLEAVQSFSEPSLNDCPTCGGKLRKKFSAVGVVFKGSGFYRNDSRSEARAGERKADSGDTSDTKSDKTDKPDKGDKSDKGDKAGSTPKPETKSEPAAAKSSDSKPKADSGSSPGSASKPGSGPKASNAA